jgi:hypothetical protein
MSEITIITVPTATDLLLKFNANLLARTYAKNSVF